MKQVHKHISQSALQQARRAVIADQLRGATGTPLTPFQFEQWNKAGIARGQAERAIDELVAEGRAEIWWAQGVLVVGLVGEPTDDQTGGPMHDLR